MKIYKVHFLYGNVEDIGFVVNEQMDFYEDHTAESLYQKLLDVVSQVVVFDEATIEHHLEAGRTCVAFVTDHTGTRVFMHPEAGCIGVITR